MSRVPVLLDAGGIILDESALEDAFCEAIVKVLCQCGYDYTSEQYWRDYKEGIVCFCPRSVDFVLWKVAGGDEDEFNRVFQAYKKSFVHPPLQLMDGIDEQLRLLADEYNLILAGQYGKVVYDLLDRHGLSDLFINRISQDDFAITKPDPRYLLQIADRAGVNPADCIMIGDRIDKDVVPARQAGMKSVWVKSSIYRIQSPRIPEECPDVTVESVKESYAGIERV